MDCFYYKKNNGLFIREKDYFLSFLKGLLFSSIQ